MSISTSAAAVAFGTLAASELAPSGCEPAVVEPVEFVSAPSLCAVEVAAASSEAESEVEADAAAEGETADGEAAAEPGEDGSEVDEQLEAAKAGLDRVMVETAEAEAAAIAGEPLSDVEKDELRGYAACAIEATWPELAEADREGFARLAEPSVEPELFRRACSGSGGRRRSRGERS